MYVGRQVGMYVCTYVCITCIVVSVCTVCCRHVCTQARCTILHTFRDTLTFCVMDTVADVRVDIDGQVNR